MTEACAIVKNTGIGLSYQDTGRLGWAKYGVAPAGAMDRHAFQQANTLLGNHPNDTCLEMTMGCVTIQFLRDTWIALAGAAHSKQLPSWSAKRMSAGERLSIQPSKHGIWSYLAVPGGFHCERPFGSASRHERSRLGQSIATNTKLLSSLVANPFPGIAARYLDSCEIRDYSQPPVIRVCHSPHDIPEDITQKLYQSQWEISNQSDRTGFRLEGPKLKLEANIRSLPTLPGTIQLPPSGQPIVTLHDGPTCGGYPILGIIHPDDLSYFVQHAPRSHVRFASYK